MLSRCFPVGQITRHFHFKFCAVYNVTNIFHTPETFGKLPIWSHFGNITVSMSQKNLYISSIYVVKILHIIVSLTGLSEELSKTDIVLMLNPHFIFIYS